MKGKKHIVIIILLVIIVFGMLSLVGNVNKNKNWIASKPFKFNELELLGTKGKFGMIKMNGDENEPAFLKKQGRLYDLYFLDKTKNTIGKNFLLTAIHEDSKKSVTLYEWGIENNKSSAKISFDKEGLWKVDVKVNRKPYTSFIIEVK